MASSAEERYERERAFHDERFSREERSADRFYNDSIDRALEAFLARLAALPPRMDVLDYGCGSEAHTAIHLAQRGHRVMAVDLSPVAIAHARARAEELGLGDSIDFRVGNCEALPLPDAAVDIVAGTGVLHHVDLDAAYPEIARILRRGGQAMFIEPLGHNSLLKLYRARTPEQRTPDEHPLVTEDFDLARRWFERLDLQFFTLASIVTLPFARLRRSQGLIDRLDAADRFLFRRVPALRPYAWRVLMTLGGPRAP